MTGVASFLIRADIGLGLALSLVHRLAQRYAIPVISTSTSYFLFFSKDRNKAQYKLLRASTHKAVFPSFFLHLSQNV